MRDDLEKLYSQMRVRSRLRRSLAQPGEDRFLWDYVAAELADRLRDVARTFSAVLLIAPDGRYAEEFKSSSDCVVTHLSPAEIDGMLPVEPHSHDLVVTFGFLDHVDDLPGMLFQLRHCLRPDGLLLASLLGPGSLSTLRRLMIRAEGDRPAQRIHPQLKLESLAELAGRAGLAMPVVDRDELTVRYSSLEALRTDLLYAGLGNALATRPPYLGKAGLANLRALWDEQAERGGKVTEYFTFLHLSGWSPPAS